MPGRGLWTVSELTAYIKNNLDHDPFLRNIWLRGEISNFRHYQSGHMYFTLKDADSCIKCAMFRANTARLLFLPQDGMQLIARGYISIYPAGGNYQLYVQELMPDGKGSLQLAFEQLKEKLQKEGLFSEELKKQLPFLPRRVGIVTSPDGAAVRDIIAVCQQRYPGIELILAPATVQGETAPRDVARSIELLNRYGAVDVIIVGRGGGSIEELWAFNSETVARAIFASRIPVVSAVGHETDFTIADFVADLRAPTPSAAAQMVVPVKVDLRRLVKRLGQGLELVMGNRTRFERGRLEYLKNREVMQNPLKLLNQYYQRLDELQPRLVKEISILLQQSRGRQAKLVAQLEALSPLAILNRGYAICSDRQGRPVKDACSQQPGDRLEILLSRGALDCEVKGIKG